MSDQSQPSRKLQSVYNELRLEGQFCDAVIKVEDVEFQVHKVILSNCTPYFRAFFTRWEKPDQKVFNIPGVSPAMMQLIIEFTYTGSLSVTEDNVQELLLAADQFNVMDIVQICADFLERQLCPNNCIGIWQFTNICLHPELQHKAYLYIIRHFEEVVSHEELLQLSAEDLTDIIDRDDLNVNDEQTVYEAMMRWIAHAPEERKRSIAVLLSKVRLALLTDEYIRNNVMSSELIQNNAACLSMVNEVTRLISYSTANSISGYSFCYPYARPRLPNDILLAIGGWSGGDPTISIEAYDFRADCWFSMTDHLEYPRAYHGVAFLDGYVYCVGGFDRVDCFNGVSRFDLARNTWEEVAPMYHRRCYVSVTVLNGCIYAMGGFDGLTRLSTAERYRPEINQWSLIAPMNEQRSDASCATLNNKIYICGGFNGNECLCTAEYYSPATNQWTVITPMSSHRSGIGVAAYADHVYAVGGFDGNSRLDSAEVYNPRTNTWHNVSPMLSSRSNFGIEVIDNCLFVAGGFNGFNTTYNVEYYDPIMDVWTEACNMEIFRSALSCCVIPRPSNMVNYIVPDEAFLFLDLEDEESGFEDGD